METIHKSSQKVVINDATFSETVTGADFSLDVFDKLVILIKTGTKTGSPTLDAKLQYKDDDGNYYDHTSATQVTAAGTSIKEITNLAGRTGRIVVTYGGSGSFAATRVTVELKS